MCVVMYCSLAKSGRLSCVARSWEFRFAMLNLNQNDLLALLPLELSKMCFNDRLLGLRKIAVLLHEVTAGKLPLIVLPVSCIISCVKPYYFRSAFRSVFLRSGFHSCPHVTAYETDATKRLLDLSLASRERGYVARAIDCIALTLKYRSTNLRRQTLLHKHTTTLPK